MVHSAERESYSFRTRLLVDTVIPTFLFPPLLCSVLLRLLKATDSGVNLPRLLIPLLYVASIPTCLSVRVHFEKWREAREARRMGAKLIPRLRGKWPGNLDILLKLVSAPRKGYILDGVKAILESAGSNTVNLNILWVDQFITMDDDLVKFMLATGFDHFDKGVEQKERLEDLFGNGIFNRDGDIWKKHRATTRPFFARERIADFEHFERFSRKTLQILDQFGPDDPVDVQDLFARFTLDAASAFLFNTNLDTLSLPLPKAYKAKCGPKGSAIEGDFGAFATAFEETQQILSLRNRQRATWRFLEFFKNASTPHMNVIKDYLDPLVRQALAEKEEYKKLGQDGKEDETSGSFIRYLAITTNDVTTIREELLNILLASRDTTASLLTSVVYMFSLHPDITKKLRSEVLSVCPPGKIPTYDDIRKLKYRKFYAQLLEQVYQQVNHMRAVLNETLRLFAPVPANVRSSKDAVAIPVKPYGKSTDTRPIYIAAEKTVVFFPFLVHRRKDLWGPDADVFDPNRWLDDGTGRLERMIKNPLMFVPFNAGPRICLGQQFALNEASFFLVRLLQTYDRFDLALDAQPEGSLPPPEWTKIKDSRASVDKVWLQSSVTLYMKGGLWLKLKKPGSTETA